MPADYDNLTGDESGEAVIVMTPVGGVVQWNQSAETMFGYTSAEAVGRTLEELIMLPGQAREEEQFLKDTAENGFCWYESYFRRKDGSLVYVFSSNTMLRDPQSETGLIVSKKQDTTRSNTLRDVKLVEEKYGALLESMPDAIIITSLTGHIVLANRLAEKLLGYERGELITRLVEVLMPERFRGAHAAHRRAYLTQPRTRLMWEASELYCLRKDGTEFRAEISLCPLPVEQNALVVSAIRNVSKRKKTGG